MLAEGDNIESAIRRCSRRRLDYTSIKHIHLEGVRATVEDCRVVKHRVSAKPTFVVEADRK